MADTMWARLDGALMELDALAEGDMPDDATLDEYRPCEPSDLPDYADDIADAVREWLWESDTLSHDDGGPELDTGAFANAIRAAVAKALREHTDLSDAAGQPTGRTMTAGEARALLWHPDGTPKAREVG